MTTRNGEVLRVGIIGCGGIGRNAHIPGYEQLDDVALVAFCDIDEDRARQTAKEHGTKDAQWFTSVDEMFSALQLDAVSVCTPNFDHRPSAITAMRHGAHVLCEKPMAMNTTEAQEMLAVAREEERILTIGYQWRFRADAQYTRQLIQDGRLGDIYFAKIHYLRRRGVPSWGFSLDREMLGGGPLIDLATHVLDLALWLMDYPEPLHVSATVSRHLAERGENYGWSSYSMRDLDVEDFGCAHVAFEGGKGLYLESSWALNIADSSRGVELFGTRAGVKMTRDGMLVNTLDRGNPVNMAPDRLKKVNAQHAKVADFVDSIRSGRKPLVTAEQALLVTRIIEAVYESGKRQEPVPF